MKILHVETGQHLYGGAKQVAFLLDGLQELGVENVLCAPKNSAIALQTEAKNIPCRTTDSAGDLDWHFFWQARRIMKQEKPDLVHLHSRRGADVLGGIAAKTLGLPCVLSRRVDNREPGWVVKLKYRLYDHIITISRGIQTVLLDEGVAADKISCVHSAVDLALYQHPASREEFRQTFGLPEQVFSIGIIAQLIKRKGHRYLLQIVPELIRRHPDLRILVFGKGPLDAELKLYVQEHDLQNHVIFTGFRDDLERWLGCLDLVVHPADIEGLGVSLLQAAAAGVPIIASRTGGIPEIVRHEQNGLLTAPGDETALLEAISRLVSEPETRHSMRQAAQNIVTEHFSLQHMIEGNYAVYQRVLGT
ncbi:MAG: glycosyltransferase [Thiolinea sp.]